MSQRLTPPNASPVTCFTPGTAITTSRGMKPVLELREGDRVLTRDRGFQPIIWCGSRAMSTHSLRQAPDMHPVRIRAGALGNDLPCRDMLVSPRHRMLINDPTLIAGTGDAEVLVEAAALVGRPGVDRVVAQQLTYCHILFEQHEIILSDNSWSESFHLSGPTLSMMNDRHTRELRALFPDMARQGSATQPPLARMALSVEQSHALAQCA